MVREALVVMCGKRRRIDKKWETATERTPVAVRNHARYSLFGEFRRGQQ